MRVRFSTALGLSVADQHDDAAIGTLAGMLIHPDSLRIEGFFVRVPGFLSSEELFLGQEEIVHWGTSIRIRDADVLSPLEERVRLAALVSDARTVLGQRMYTEEGRLIGVCHDVQFDTATCSLEWLFPRLWWRWRRAVPASAVREVTQTAIIVREFATVEGTTDSSVLSALDPLARTPMQS